MRLSFLFAVLVLATCTSALAADLAVLRNGNSIRHERKEVLGAVTRLYLGPGYIEIPSDQIDHYERDSSPPPALLGAVARPEVAVNPQRQQALTPQALNQVLSGAGERNQIDPDFIRSVIKAESGFHQNAVSRKGALGLMQLMPGTASQLGVTNPFDPNSNVEGGTKYLRDLLEKYHFDVNKALAAYNAGPMRVDQYHGVPPYYETQAYISRIIRDFNRRKIAKNPALASKVKASARHSGPSKPASGTSRVPGVPSANRKAEHSPPAVQTASR